ncbi:MAG: O-antigen ligase family protein, partial [Actinobacteria bacterium]|nr:O-antigen ligase family protein [Actinomycetota bacterium]
MTLNQDAPTTEREIRFARLQIPRWMLICFALLGEVVLALALKDVRFLGFVHAMLIIAVGFYGLLRRDLSIVILTIAYTTGSEVLWRQTRVPVFYLTAPYLVIALSLLSVILVLRHLGRDARLAALYGLLLLPAAAATIRTAGSGSREIIAFALSGPIALATFVMVTSQVTMTRQLYRRMLWTILVSTVGPLTIAVSDMREDLATSAITFSKQSNFATSGGFGPVQVSAALSIGMMAAVLLIVIERERITRVIAAVLTLALAVQTLLTFSRGGSFSLGIAVAVFAITQSRDRRIRNRIILFAAISLALAYFIVFPRLESFTGGMFQQRFSNTETARTELATNDLQIFGRNFLFGVGPGMTKYQRLTYEICKIRTDNCASEASSHTEFTRMLSEHGIPGVVALVL